MGRKTNQEGSSCLLRLLVVDMVDYRIDKDIDIKENLIDEIRTLLNANEENKYCDALQLKAYINIVLKKVA